MTTLSTLVLAAEEGGDEGGSFLVQPGVGLMIWTLLVFGVSMLILWKLAFPRIAEALDKRQRLIEDSIESANRTKAEAGELLEEYRTRLKDARSQAEDILVRARKAGEETEREAVEAARLKREELMEQARRDIEAEERKALQDVRKEVASLTVLATEKVTRKTLTPEDQKRLVDEALSELDFTALGGSRN
jgi:F-type H+-transporting ATPase subunit b